MVDADFFFFLSLMVCGAVNCYLRYIPAWFVLCGARAGEVGGVFCFGQWRVSILLFF